ncbi:MAG: hypothetical protein MK089_05480 [Phycisphaerales bacterium]|nr:hypothetical protein [Phycisphaerales bacterium]
MSEELPTGFSAHDTLPEHTHTALLELMGQGTLNSVDSIGLRLHDQGLDAIMNLRWTTGTGKNRTSHVRTVFFAHRPESQLPEFSIQPVETFLGFKLFSSSGTNHVKVDMQTLDGLDSRISFTSPTPESARHLLMISALSLNHLPEGLSVFGNHNGSITWLEDELLEGQARVKLIEDSIRFLDPIVNTPDLGRRVAHAVQGTYAMEEIDRLRKANTSTARKQLLKFVTRSEVDQVIASTPPRRIPKTIRKRAMSANKLSLVFCCGLTLFGLLIGLYVLIETMNRGSSFPWESLFFLAVGFVFMIGTIGCIGWRRYRLKTLHEGVFIPARIIGIKATRNADEDNVDHEVEFQPTDQTIGPLTLTIGSDAARIARRLKHRGGETTLLIHPSKASSSHWSMADPAIWLEGWVIENIPD